MLLNSVRPQAQESQEPVAAKAEHFSMRDGGRRLNQSGVYSQMFGSHPGLTERHWRPS
jgi:hypothetical protein